MTMIVIVQRMKRGGLALIVVPLRGPMIGHLLIMITAIMTVCMIITVDLPIIQLKASLKIIILDIMTVGTALTSN